MKRRTTTTNLILIVFIVVFWVSPILSGPPPDSLSITFDNRIAKLETAQNYLNVIISGLASVIVILLTVQTVVTHRREKKQDEIQAIREKKQEELQAIREEKQDERQKSRDDLERDGAKRVANIMGVIDQTLRSRLTAEEEERKKREDTEQKAKETEETVKNLFNQVAELQEVIKSMRYDVQKVQNNLEQTAADGAQNWDRHDFRGQAKWLNDFVHQYENFKSDAVRFGVKANNFSTRVQYILGMAHYINEPEIAIEYLNKVIQSKLNEFDQTEADYNRRVANAYFYLGLTESNFKNHGTAISHFEKAQDLDLHNQDFLTRIVMAEAYAMADDFSRALQLVEEVESGLVEKKNKEGRLLESELWLDSRAPLIKANIAILKQKNYAQAKEILEPVHKANPQYYYATATLAQTYAALDEFDKAKDLFREAHGKIENTRFFKTLTEVRSKILLLLIAGMCAKHGSPDNERVANSYLDEANSLRQSLPKIGTQYCTVFSPLSKRNENSETIYLHIDLIRKGQIFL